MNQTCIQSPLSKLAHANKRLCTALGLGALLALSLVPRTQAQTTEAYTYSNVAIGGGGFVSGIITSKTQPGLMYARTDVGGAYRWDPTGNKWIPLVDWASENEQGLLGVESLAIDPQQPRNLYATCGISYFNNGRSFVLRSSDYGATFNYVDVTAQFKVNGNGMGRNNGEKLQVDPNNSSILYTGTRYNGLFKSADAGSTWTRLPALDVTNTPNGNGISFVLLDKTSVSGGATQRIFAGISRNTDANFYRSNDAGATFTAVANPNLAAGMMPQRVVQAGDNLYISYGNGAGPYGTTFAATNTQPASNEPYGAGQIWKYNITAGTWTEITPKDAMGVAINHAFGGISVDPTNANRLMVSTTNNYQLQGTVYGDRFYYSTDGGTTWTDIIASRGFVINPDGVTWIAGQSIHWAGCVEFDPANLNHVIVVSGNGIYVNEDINTSNVWKFLGRGLEETVPLNLVSIPSGPLVSVIGDYDGFVHTDVTQYAPIHNPRIGSTSGLDYAKLSTSKLVRVGSRSNSTAASVLLYSTDQGVTWTRTPTMNGSSGQVALSADGSVLLHSPTNGASTSFPVADNTFVYRTTDNGATWTKATGVPTTLTSSRPVADAVNANKFYIHNSNTGDMLVSTDGGVSFAVAGNVGATGGSRIVRAIPGREGHLWVALYGGGLTRSVNSGTTFTKLTNVTYCGAVGYGKAATTTGYLTLYIWGTVNGVLGIHRSVDEGATWVRVNDDAHEYGGPANGQFVMGDMNVYGRVYMSTAGRGIVYGSPATALAATPATLVVADALNAYPNPVENSVTLKVPKALVGGSVSVVNYLGAVVRTGKAAQATSSLDLNGLAPGLYIIRVANGKQSEATRFFKK